jgi:dTDP-4-dehydrorhamnose reductase
VSSGSRGKRVLVLGGTGMLGHVVLSQLAVAASLEVYGTVRDPDEAARWFSPEILVRCLRVDAFNFDSVIRALSETQPEVVINCIGIVKQSSLAKDPVTSIYLNSWFPHRLALSCRLAGARLIHLSTDCIFDGARGNYREEDPVSAQDLYGRSKALGEVTSQGCLTVRTSILGHELRGKLGLIEWFLAQEGEVRGFTRAIFSGFPTVVLAGIIRDLLLVNSSLTGVYHISAAPIAKYDLLKLVATEYGKEIAIIPDDSLKVDRSLDASSFRKITGYTPPFWPEMVAAMHQHYLSSTCYKKIT